jgi:hypothetical protein
MTIRIVVSACSTLEIPGRDGESVPSWEQFAEAFSDIDCLYCGTAGNAPAVPQPDSLVLVVLVVRFLNIELLPGDRRPRPGVLLQGPAKVTVRIRFDPEQLPAVRLVDADELTYG